MNSFVSTDWTAAIAFIVDCAVKGGIVIALAAGLAWLLRRESAAARHSVWTAAIVAQLLIPILAFVMPTWAVGVIDRPAPSAPAEQIAPAPTAEFTESSKSSAAVSPTPTPVSPVPATSRRLSPVMIVGALWMLGALAVLLRFAVGTAIVSRMASRGQRVVDEKWLGTMHRLAVSLGIRRPLTLLRGDTVGVPVTWGIVYPVVFLPSDADAWPEERRRYVLVHEMAHVKRLDAFTQLVAQLVTAIFWFNPLVWLAVSRMRRERENACDDYVLTHGTRASEYASDLLELVRSMGSRNKTVAAPAFAALAMARRSEFEGRMLSILDPEAPRASVSTTKVAVSAAAALLLIVPLSAFSPFNANTHTLPVPQPASRITEGPQQTPGGGPVKEAANAKSVAPAQAATSSDLVATTFSGLIAGPCDRMDGSTTSSSHISEDDDFPTSRRIQLLRRKPGYCYEAAMSGVMTFAGDLDVREMSPEARLRIRERTVGSDREIILKGTGRGIEREYYENGARAAYGEPAQRWFSTVLRTAIRESGIDAQRRVARIAQERGANGVLQEIGEIQSSGAKRNYYMAYLQSGVAIGDDELARLIRQAQADLSSSSGDMSNVLRVAAQRGLRTPQTRSAFGDAAAAIESDGDKTTVLTVMAMTADRDMLIEVMRAARTIDSDGDKSRLLIATAARYLIAKDPELRDSYFTVVEQVGSDGDRARVLISASAYGHADENVTLACIRGTHAMSSDGDKASVLISMAGRRLLVNQKIKDAFLAETNRISSDSDRARVLSAVVGSGI